MSGTTIDEKTQGLTNEQGTTGKTGSRGVQGYKGAQGAQGVQGYKGVQGAQGYKGCTGKQGAQGVNGTQGIQGLKGGDGAQGYRGCTGSQGSVGTAGAQGVQGKKGVQGNAGFKGIQGVPGVQGVQGSKGRPGEKGYMGYQGDDGEVGIQGVTGEKGSVWVDGIRLNGYNTHLFEYDTDEGKFVSKNANEDLLYIRNGAKIAIWLDQEAYEAIGVNGQIDIDRLENGQLIETHYPVYYAGTKGLYEVIIPSNDLNTIVELVYKDNAWYYSGGLLTATITDDIIVTGVELGQLHEGALVKAGTTIQELFQSLLVKEIDVHGVNPKLAINVVSGNIVNKKIYEIGDTINGVLGSTYTDGKFVGDEGYAYSVDAGCPEGVLTYKQNSENLESDTVSITNISECEITFSATASYGSSTVVPRTNVGNLSEVTIDGGNVNTGNITISGCYKMFYGIQSAATASTIDDPETYQFTEQSDLETLTSGWLQRTGSTSIDMISSTNETPSFVVVIPEEWEIESTKNSLGQSVNIDTTWYRQNKIAYSNNGIQTWYQVYVSPSTEATTYNDIVLSR